MTLPTTKKVLLIRPAQRQGHFGDISFMPLGIGYIAAVLERAGYQVRVLDLMIRPLEDEAVLDLVAEFQPSMVGFTAVTPVVKSAFRLATLVKERFPGVATMIGGPHATALPEECLDNGLDFVVSGEGEETTLELLENLDAPEKVRSILFKRDGAVVRTPTRPYIQDLDALPFPARHLFPPLALYKGQEALGNANPVGSILTSRGCPFGCKFCFKAVFGSKFRARSAESVLAEWEHLVRVHHVKEVAIVDDSFTTDTRRVHAICDGLIKLGLKRRWCCPNGIRVDLGDYDMLRRMREAGCYRVALGIESGSQKVLDSIGKNITLERIEATVKNCRRAGIKTMGFFMLGNLGETRETMEQTIQFARKLRLDYAQFLLAMPYPGSGLYEAVSKQGRILVEDWDHYGMYEGVASFECGTVTTELLKEMNGRVKREYYLSPDILLRQALNPETYRYLPRRLKALLRMLRPSA